MAMKSILILIRSESGVICLLEESDKEGGWTEWRVHYDLIGNGGDHPPPLPPQIYRYPGVRLVHRATHTVSGVL